VIPGKQYTPEDIVKIAWRRKWLIVVPFVVITSGTSIATRFLRDQYRSQTMILVIPQRVPDSYVRPTVTARIEDRLQSISPQILSRPRLERIINDFDLYPALRQTAPMEEVVEQMRTKIEVQVVKGDAFRVSYISAEPSTAMKVTERLSSLFIDENLRDRERQAEGTSQFIETQLESARQTLKEQEAKLEAYRRQHANDMPSQLNSNMQGQHNAEMQVQALVDSLNADRERRLLLQRLIGDLTTQGDEAPVTVRSVEGSGASPEPTSAVAQLAAARASLKELETRLTPQHPDVTRAKKQIAELEEQARTESTRRPGAGTSESAPMSAAAAARATRLADFRQELDNVSRQIAAKEERELTLRGLIAQYQSRIQAVPIRESELAELTRDYETIQQSYKSLLAKKEDSKIAANLERQQVGEQFRVLEPANLPEKPFTPNRPRLNFMGAAAGLALGLFVVGLLEFLDTRLRSEDDVILALKLPVLATIPLVGRKSVWRTLRT
jgi:protein tyrosine kinase modulator